MSRKLHPAAARSGAFSHRPDQERIRMRRVVITGMGIVCPLGHGIETVWRRLVNGRSGIRPITTFNTDLPSRVAGQVRSSAWGTQSEPARADRPGHLARIAAAEALEDAGWQPRTAEAQAATGVAIGSGCGALEALSEGARPAACVDSSFILRGMIHSIATDLAQRFGLHGPRRAVSTACSSGAHAIGDAARMVALGDAEVMLAGGTEAAVSELGMAGFAAARALSTGFNDTPHRASRPWDRDRDGFVMGEGAGMVVLESLEHARARGARIHAELAGYGMSGDAWHITSPSESGDGAFRAMCNALRSAGLAPSDIGYVNAHGTSTPMGDDIELAAVERLFAQATRGLAMSSTKSATGHLLGAAGAVEAIFSALAIRDGVVPPTLNLEAPSRASPIDRIARTAQERPVRVAMSNSFGFGGTNASLVLRAV
jgi:3-oxoacyl-[acyl-carrier-protein] synthase II